MATFIGRVIGTKMQKTAKVEVCRMFLHPHVLKYIRHRKNFLVHDEEEECVEGDIVMIKSCPPISKRKNFTIHEVIEKAPRYTPPSSAEEATPTTTPTDTASTELQSSTHSSNP